MSPTAPSKPKKRDQILQAAARVFARKGFSGTVMADIATTAGIGKGTIYDYFASKEDLFFAVFEWHMMIVGSSASVGVAALSGSVSERLTILSDTLMSTWSAERELFSLVMEFWAASAASLMRERFKKAFHALYDEYRTLVTALLREGITHGEFRPDIPPESVAAGLVGTWDALLLQAWFDESFDPVRVAKDCLHVMIDGLKPATRQVQSQMPVL